MADLKITQLNANTSPVITDIVPMVDDPGGTPATQKITMANLLSLAWPIGSVFTSVVSTNPATLLGFGTWSAFGAGKVLVGLDSGDTDFDTAEETGGAKTHTLTTAEMPAHVHEELAPTSASSGALKFGIDTNASGSQAAGLNTASTGGGGAHNNLQPYIVVYFFKRTA